MASTPLSDAPRTLVLLNPHAGGGRAMRLRSRLERVLAAQPVPTAQLTVPGDVASALACIDALPPGSRVVVVGGDGTLNRLLPALLRGAHTLALVAAGSGNDTARALGVRRLTPEAALRLALGAPATPMDVGQAEFELPQGRQCVPFLSSLTAGFDSAVGLRAMNGPRRLQGLPRYLLATLRELLALRNGVVHVELDGQVLHDGAALFASTLNTPTYASGMPCVPHARTDDGRLDLLLAGPLSRLGTLVMLPLLLAGRHLGHPKVQTRPFREMRLSAPEPVPLAADGEYLGAARQIRIVVQAGALPVVRAPAS
jgi:diacylglycerol kinase family enzyme